MESSRAEVKRRAMIMLIFAVLSQVENYLMRWKREA